MASYKRETRFELAKMNCYVSLVIDFLQKNDKDFLKKTISHFYGSEPKELLWQNYSTHLPSQPRHKRKKSKDSNVTDVLNVGKLIGKKFSNKSLPIEYYALRKFTNLLLRCKKTYKCF